jgi:predicted amidohydrolase YtcJ
MTILCRRLLFLFSMVLIMTTHAPEASAQRSADWVLRAATIHTGDPGLPAATALAVRGDRVVYVGDEAGLKEWIGPGTRVVDGEDMYVYPGLVDAHAHLYSLGRMLANIQLRGTVSLDETLARVREGMTQVPADAWILGRGWDQNDWPEMVYPTVQDLDAVVGERPAHLTRVDGHAAWVSSAVLRLAGITRETPDPEGGRILRDENGDATGILIDNAIDLAVAVRPKPTREELRQRILLAQDACLAVGLTGMHDMGTSSEELAVLRELDRQGALRLRVYSALEDNAELWSRELPAGPHRAAAGKRLTVRAVKLYADGALGSRGAALFEDYSDEPGNRGLFLTPPDSLQVRARRAAEAGYQVCIHAIGDRGNRVALDALAPMIEWAGYQEENSVARDPRHRVEHVQILNLDDLPRFKELGIIASMQPTHCTSDMPWAPDRLGGDRIRGGYAWRDLLESGAVLAFGSDFPIESHDPRLGLYAAVTRQTTDGKPEGGWSPGQRLTMEEAITAFTWAAAYCAHQEDSLGRLAIGRTADMTILDRRLEAGSPQSILEAQVRATIVDGQLEFAPDGSRELREGVGSPARN